MKVARITGLFAALLLLAACVTINIYFPAAQAEEAAERIVNDILGKEQQPETSDDDKGALLMPGTEPSLGIALLDFLIPSAQAATPDFNVDTPKIRSIQAGMKKRHQSLTSYYASGAIGYTRDALVGIRDTSAIPLKERNRVKKLVAADNKDRNALYQAIADANGHPEWEPEVRATFMKKWVKGAESGWWYQDDGGSWKHK
jgi:uncharacterized protein YdbL (DUF1318 family)